jgi:succinate dehydrogenase/fumarate reductase flavoprotein subunit
MSQQQEQEQQNKVIVIGGGLAGLSAAHTVLENGGSVVLLDKSAFLGGNSTKATSGINGTSIRVTFVFLPPISLFLS